MLWLIDNVMTRQKTNGVRMCVFEYFDGLRKRHKRRPSLGDTRHLPIGSILSFTQLRHSRKRSDFIFKMRFISSSSIWQVGILSLLSTFVLVAANDLIPAYTIGHAPEYGMNFLPQQLSDALTHSITVHPRFPHSYVETIPTNQHPLSQKQITDTFAAADARTRQLVNLGPVDYDVKNYAVAFPINHPNVVDARGEKTFAILSAHAPRGEGQRNTLFVHGMVNAKNVDGWEGAARAS